MYKFIIISSLCSLLCSCTQWNKVDKSEPVSRFKQESLIYGNDLLRFNNTGLLKGFKKNQTHTVDGVKDLDKYVIPTFLETVGGTRYELDEKHVRSKKIQKWNRTNYVPNNRYGQINYQK